MKYSRRDKVKEELKAVTARAQAAAANVLKLSREKDRVKQELAQEKANHQKTKDTLNGRIMGLESKIKQELKTMRRNRQIGLNE